MCLFILKCWCKTEDYYILILNNFIIKGEDESERERECTEHYDIAIQRHVDSLRRPHVSLGEEKRKNEGENATNVVFQSSTDLTTDSVANEPLNKYVQKKN